MIMKNRGFTLIELLVVIALISIISISAGVGINQMLNRQNTKNLNDYKEAIENAACTYVEVTGTTATSISVTTLISSGYLDKDITNPSTKVKAADEGKSVTITIDNYERKCTYNI